MNELDISRLEQISKECQNSAMDVFDKKIDGKYGSVNNPHRDKLEKEIAIHLKDLLQLCFTKKVYYLK